MRLDNGDAVAESGGEHFGDPHRRALAEIVDVRLEGQTKQRRAAPCRLDQCGGAGDDMVGLSIVDVTRSADQRGQLWSRMNDEPRVDRNTMSADAWSRGQNIDPRVTVGERNDIPHIDAQLVGNQAQLIGEGDVDVTERVFAELHHLGDSCCRRDTRAAHKRAVERKRFARTARRYAADAAVVID